MARRRDRTGDEEVRGGVGLGSRGGRLRRREGRDGEHAPETGPRRSRRHRRRRRNSGAEGLDGGFRDSAPLLNVGFKTFLGLGTK